MRAEEKGVVAIDQTDRGRQLRLRSNFIDISTSGWGCGQASRPFCRVKASRRAEEVIELFSDFRFWHLPDVVILPEDVCFSNRPVGVKRFQAKLVSHSDYDVPHGLRCGEMLLHMGCRWHS